MNPPDVEQTWKCAVIQYSFSLTRWARG